MILHGNARGGASDLARHLLRDDENDHVYVHEISGFMADDLYGAFHEVEALSRGTRCEKFLFSLSISPPMGANISTEDFERAADKAEAALGLSGQPRAIVFHEKGDNRDRHAHVVWSRINLAEMKAIPMPFNRMRMREVSRDLFIEHGLDVPRGLVDRSERNPLNYTLEEYQHAKRTGKDARSIKSQIQDAWASSDNAGSFSAALQERGYRLARGDRRGFVAVDTKGEVYALAKWIGVKIKTVRERIGPEVQLPSVDQTRERIASDMLGKIDQFQSELDKREAQRKAEHSHQRRALIERQRSTRAQEFARLKSRQEQEALERQSRFRKGLGGVWDFLRGEHARIKAQNEREAHLALQRDRAEKDRLIHAQMLERQHWRARAAQIKQRDTDQRTSLEADRQSFVDLKKAAREAFKAKRRDEQDHLRNRGPTLER